MKLLIIGWEISSVWIDLVSNTLEIGDEGFNSSLGLLTIIGSTFGAIIFLHLRSSYVGRLAYVGYVGRLDCVGCVGRLNNDGYAGAVL